MTAVEAFDLAVQRTPHLAKVVIPITAWVALRAELERETPFVWRSGGKWPQVGVFRGRLVVEVGGLVTL